MVEFMKKSKSIELTITSLGVKWRCRNPNRYLINNYFFFDWFKIMILFYVNCWMLKSMKLLQMYLWILMPPRYYICLFLKIKKFLPKFTDTTVSSNLAHLLTLRYSLNFGASLLHTLAVMFGIVRYIIKFPQKLFYIVLYLLLWFL